MMKTINNIKHLIFINAEGASIQVILVTSLCCGNIMVDECLMTDLWSDLSRYLQSRVASSKIQRALIVSTGPSRALSAVSAIRNCTNSDFHWRALTDTPGESHQSDYLPTDPLDVFVYQSMESKFIQKPANFTNLSDFRDVVNLLSKEGKVDFLVVDTPFIDKSFFLALICIVKGTIIIKAKIDDCVPYGDFLELTEYDNLLVTNFAGIDHSRRNWLKNELLNIFETKSDSTIRLSSKKFPDFTQCENPNYLPLLPSDHPHPFSQDEIDEILKIRETSIGLPLEEISRCSSITASFTLKREELSAAAQAAFYVKKSVKKIPADKLDPSRSPYMDPLLFFQAHNLINCNSVSDPDLSLLPWSDALINGCNRNPRILYESVGLMGSCWTMEISIEKVWGLSKGVSDCSLVMLDSIEEISMSLPLVRDRGDLLIRLSGALVCDDEISMSIFRLAQMAEEISLVRTSCDPKNSYCFVRCLARSKVKNFRIGGGIVRALIWDPEWLGFIKSFNNKVLRDRIRISCLGRHSSKDPISWQNATELGLKPFLTDKSESVGIYFGTFDPPHANHLSLIQSAIELSIVNKVLVIPNKDGNLEKKTASSVDDRLAMARIAFEKKFPGLINVFANDEETRSWLGKERIAKKVSEKFLASEGILPRPVLLLGEDSFRKAVINGYGKSCKGGISQVKIPLVVFPRTGGTDLEIPNSIIHQVTVVKDYLDPIPGLSSTRMREEISRGDSPSGVDAEVLEWARNRRLYKSHSLEPEDLEEDSLFPED